MNTREVEIAALIALLQTSKKGTAWGTIASQVSAEGSAKALLDRTGEALFLNPETDAAIDAAELQVRAWCEAGLELTTVLDDDYPVRLRDIREMPPFLFYKGDLRACDMGMSVVGSRRASAHGCSLAADVSRLLVNEGLAVIAGLAEGIDTAAHRAALDVGGRTVAFIGTGINRKYPASNAALQDEIARRGLVLSQFYPDAAPTKQSFPIRNVSMSGYGLATIVIEAGEHSGSRIQARVAGQHGRPVILVDRVAESTSWGSALVGDPNVYVVSSMAEVRDAVSDVLNSPSRLNDALAALTAS